MFASQEKKGVQLKAEEAGRRQPQEGWKVHEKSYFVHARTGKEPDSPPLEKTGKFGWRDTILTLGALHEMLESCFLTRNLTFFSLFIY